MVSEPSFAAGDMALAAERHGRRMSPEAPEAPEAHVAPASPEPHARGCPFCERRDLELTLAETPHFYLLADHAPLIEGHLLIVPHGHYACYGAVPAEYEAEFAALKWRTARFFASAYRAPTFFEHGVYRQTVFHAHLHALPFGVTPLDLPAQARAAGGRPARSLADVRAWYEERGHYFYIEEATPADALPTQATMTTTSSSSTAKDKPTNSDQPTIIGEAALFPPDSNAYGQALAPLWRSGRLLGAWRTPFERYEQRGPMLRGLSEAWRAFVANGG